MHIQTHRWFKPAISIAAAGAIAGVVAFLTTLAPEASALADTPALSQASAKADRLPLALKGSSCSVHAWPNFDRHCEFDLRTPANGGQKIRIIALR
jgi:hypothetical protein